jgi:hypothetical protein
MVQRIGRSGCGVEEVDPRYAEEVTMSASRRIHELRDEAYRCRREGRLAEAEQRYRAMVDEASRDSEVPDALRADMHHWMASFYRDHMGRMAEAEDFARRAIALEVRAGRAAIIANHRMFLSDLLERRGALREALAEAELAVDKQVE